MKINLVKVEFSSGFFNLSKEAYYLLASKRLKHIQQQFLLCGAEQYSGVSGWGKRKWRTFTLRFIHVCISQFVLAFLEEG